LGVSVVVVFAYQFVQDGRAARVHVFASRFARRMRPTNRTEISWRVSHVFPAKTTRMQI
jgi:hypothetical protein